MKRLGKKKIISLIMVLSMVITTIFSLQISNVDASTNDEKIKALIEVLQSDKIKGYITSTYSDGSVIPVK